jgi:hypothetical protein
MYFLPFPLWNFRPSIIFCKQWQVIEEARELTSVGAVCEVDMFWGGHYFEIKVILWEIFDC